jgi:hypothetical protein
MQDAKNTLDSKNALDTKKVLDANTLLEMSQIGVWIDHYDDIFSDFDPRPYSDRSLSVDFLGEARRASRDKVSGQVELQFLISEQARDRKQEPEIKKRLHSHFSGHYQGLILEQRSIKGEGTKLAISGMIIMLAATWLHFNFQDTTFFLSFLVVVFEPAGWFLMWNGLDKMLFEPRRSKPELDFYGKMSTCKISFISYK